MQKSIKEIIEELKGTEVNFAIHGIYYGTKEEKRDTAESILKSGLNLSHGWKTIKATMVSLGDKESNPNLLEDMESFQYGYGNKCNVVAGIPTFLTNSKGEKIYLGFPKVNKATAGRQYEETCVLDIACSILGKIPSEFILGYYEDDLKVQQNPKYYSNLSAEKQDNLFEVMKGAMSNLAKTISNHVVNGNPEELGLLRETAERFNRFELVEIIDCAMLEAFKQQHDKLKKETNGFLAGLKVNVDNEKPNIKRKTPNCENENMQNRYL